MGIFLNLASLYKVDKEKLKTEVENFFKNSGVKAKHTNKKKDDINEHQDIVMYTDNESKWTVLFYTQGAVYGTRLSGFLSDKLNCLVSHIRVYDGDYWAHFYFKDGNVLDMFASIPDYFEQDQAQIERLKNKYKANPSKIAVFYPGALDPADIEKYFEHIDLNKSYSKAYSSDEHNLDDFWVFTDFWKKLGIVYPEIEENRPRDVVELLEEPDKVKSLEWEEL